MSLAEFNSDSRKHLYRLWNRMSSGSYMPTPVLLVEIPKKVGGTRPLGIPTIVYRIAQTVFTFCLEPKLDMIFHKDGYSPNKSADAVGTIRARCWKYDWVLDLDINIKGFFDNIPHELLIRAVRKHTDCPWILLYIERWLKTPVQKSSGILTARSKGTVQEAVISPLLANLFLHYCMDK